MGSARRESPLVQGAPVREVWACLALLLCPSLAGSATFQILDRSSDLMGTAEQDELRASMMELADRLEDYVNRDYLADFKQDALLKAFADADRAATRGSGAQSQVEQEPFEVGARASIGWLPEDLFELRSQLHDKTLPAIGASIHASMFVGLNPRALGFARFLGLDSERVRIFLDYSSLSDRAVGSRIRYSSSGWGVHGNYRLITPDPDGLFGWNGLMISTGFEHSEFDLDYRKRLDVRRTRELGSHGLAEVHWSGDVNYGVRVRNWIVPLEVSTGVKVWRLLSFQIGVGSDFCFGTAQSAGTAEGPITAGVESPPEGFSGNALRGRGVFDLYGKSPVSATRLSGRYFLGTQISFWQFRFFGQLTHATDSSRSVLAGFRVAF